MQPFQILAFTIATADSVWETPAILISVPSGLTVHLAADNYHCQFMAVLWQFRLNNGLYIITLLNRNWLLHTGM